jgi:hypothetical protein
MVIWLLYTICKKSQEGEAGATGRGETPRYARGDMKGDVWGDMKRGVLGDKKRGLGVTHGTPRGEA